MSCHLPAMLSSEPQKSDIDKEKEKEKSLGTKKERDGGDTEISYSKIHFLFTTK